VAFVPHFPNVFDVEVEALVVLTMNPEEANVTTGLVA
jgi:hypothetical protein